MNGCDEMDWPKVIASESKTSPIIQVDDYARRYSLSSRAVNAALRRQVAKGLVERVSNKIYINKLAQDFTPRDLLSALRPDSYVSLDSALSDFGVTTQVPYSLTCVSPKYVRNIKTNTIHVTFRTLKKDLYWGFSRKKTRYATYNLAEPEKALLDWIYFKSLDGLPVEMDEFHLDGLDRNRLLEGAKKFSAPVRNRIVSLLAETPVLSQPHHH
jgi:predicted transcriptional regulator of viral defense system